MKMQLKNSISQNKNENAIKQFLEQSNNEH